MRHCFYRKIEFIDQLWKKKVHSRESLNILEKVYNRLIKKNSIKVSYTEDKNKYNC